MKPRQTAEQVREQLQDELHCELPDKVWEHLVAEEHLANFSRGGMDFDKLLEKTRRLLAIAGERVPPPLPLPLGRPTAVRQKALAKLYAQDASQDKAVAFFREKVLGGQLLDPSQVEPWIIRQVEKDGRNTRRISLPVPEKHNIEFQDSSFVIRPAMKVSKLDSFGVSLSVNVLTYKVPGEDAVRRVPTAGGEVLERLRRLAKQLARKYGWDPADAATFILTGEAPPVITVQAHAFRRNIGAASRITLEIDPAVDPRYLAAYYRQVRKWFLGRRFRSQGEKHIRLAEFAADGGEGNWAERMRTWNRKWQKKHPNWRYTSHKNFTRDCRQALRRLLGQGGRLNVETGTE